MYVGNNRKREYTNKREALLKETQEKLRLDKLKKEAFKNALWADQAEKNKINLNPTASTFTLNEIEKLKERSERVQMGMEDRNVNTTSRATPRAQLGTSQPQPMNVDEEGDIGDEVESMSDVDDHEVEEEPTDVKQKVAFFEIIEMLNDNPQLIKIKLSPTGKEGVSLRNYYIGSSAKIYNRSDKNDTRTYSNEFVDWEATLIRFKKALQLPNLQNRKSRAAVIDILDNNELAHFKDYVEDLIIERGFDLLFAYDNNDKLISRVWIQLNSKNKLVFVNQNRTEINNTDTQKVNWKKTYWRNIVRDVASRRERENPRPLPQYKTVEEIYQASIVKIYNAYHDLWTLKVKPIMMDKSISNMVFGRNANLYSIGSGNRKIKITQSILYSINWRESYLVICTKLLSIMKNTSRLQGASAFLETVEALNKKAFDETFSMKIEDPKKLANKIDEFNSNSDANKRLHQSNMKAIEDKKNASKEQSPPLEELDEAYTGFGESNVSMESMSGLGIKSRKLRGRGLRGAGVRRTNGRPYNLNDIQGSGMSSALKYKKLGSKYISLPHLDENKLKLVFPNRTSVGRITSISKPLTEALKTLTYDEDVNKQMYGKLEHEDKQIFSEVIKSCGLKYQTKQPLQEPREHLQAEFDKLRGVIMLGNDNKANLKELKSLAVDMLQNGMISKAAFKEISLL